MNEEAKDNLRFGIILLALTMFAIWLSYRI
jgi:hypothetical protein